MNTQITNINTENGYIYFHCNAQPFSLDADNKDVLFNLVKQDEITCEEEGDYGIEYDYFDHDLINDFPQFIEQYIIELKDDWIATELDAIDEGLFESGIVHVVKIESSYKYYFKDGETYISIDIWDGANRFTITEKQAIPNLIGFTFEVLDAEEATKIFIKNITESNSYLSTIAYDLLVNVTKEFKDKSSLILAF